MANMNRRSFVKGAAAGTLGVAAAGMGSLTASAAEKDEAVASTAIDWLGEEPVIDDADIADTWDTDLVIVGAGNSGLIAAAKAADLGLDFRIIEKGPVIGDERGFLGAVNSKFTEEAGCHADYATMLSELSRYASGKCDQRVIKVWLDESAEMIEYVADILDGYGFDVTFNSDTGVETSGTQYYCPPQEHGASAREDSEYADYNRNQILQDYIEKKDYHIDFNCRLIELVKDGDAVVGVIAQNTDDDTYIKINAKNVILACGGYAGNLQMVSALMPLASEVLTTTMAYPYDTGDGLKAALWAGAVKDVEPAPMLFDRGLVSPGVDAGIICDENGNYSVPGGAITTQLEYNPGTQPFLKVNRDGERFANESCPYNDILCAAFHQKGHVYAQVFDANYVENWQKFHTLGCSSLVRKIPEAFQGMVEEKAAEGIICKADTLEELADQMGFEGEAKQTFLATVERQNELFDQGEDTDFGKPTYRMSEIRTAPFYGAWLGANLLTSCDGICINTKMQALDADQNPIPGLYCVGDVSGSFFANNYPVLFPGVACGRGLTFALKAVKTIAGE